MSVHQRIWDSVLQTVGTDNLYNSIFSRGLRGLHGAMSVPPEPEKTNIGTAERSKTSGQLPDRCQVSVLTRNALHSAPSTLTTKTPVLKPPLVFAGWDTAKDGKATCILPPGGHHQLHRSLVALISTHALHSICYEARTYLLPTARDVLGLNLLLQSSRDDSIPTSSLC